MKRRLVTLVVLVMLTAGLLPAQSIEANDAYIKAMTAQSPSQKAQLLKDFLTKYGGKGNQYENFANANLAMLAYPGKPAAETITYGERALALGGLDDLSKYQVMLTVAGVYTQTGQSLDKAKSLANQAADVCKEAKSEDPAKWNQLAGAAYYVEGQALEKAKDYRGAAESYATSYGILKNPQILAALKKLGKTLYDAKAFGEAEKVFRVVSSTTRDPEITMLYAGALYKSGKTDEALSIYKEIYGKQKNGDVAFNIGIILAKRAQTQPGLASEAINFLLDASFLSQANSKQAMAMAESLFFTTYKELKWNETVNQINALSKKIEDMTKTYNGKFGDKDEEELSDGQKKEMKNLLDGIEVEKKNLEKLKDGQNVALAKFNAQIDETKRRLGIR
jgi:tetratricopeptide (TPR) repeat protein